MTHSASHESGDNGDPSVWLARDWRLLITPNKRTDPMHGKGKDAAVIPVIYNLEHANGRRLGPWPIYALSR